MDWKLFTTLLVVSLGWWVAHYLSARREVTNERRKLRVSYLLEAYRKLEQAVHPLDPKAKQEQLESAIADIQLLGSPSQVTMASEFAKSLANNSEASLDGLLFNLRESLRLELQLESVNEKIIFFRFHDRN